MSTGKTINILQVHEHVWSLNSGKDSKLGTACVKVKDNMIVMFVNQFDPNQGLQSKEKQKSINVTLPLTMLIWKISFLFLIYNFTSCV